MREALSPPPILEGNIMAAKAGLKAKEHLWRHNYRKLSPREQREGQPPFIECFLCGSYTSVQGREWVQMASLSPRMLKKEGLDGFPQTHLLVCRLCERDLLRLEKSFA